MIKWYKGQVWIDICVNLSRSKLFLFQLWCSSFVICYIKRVSTRENTEIRQRPLGRSEWMAKGRLSAARDHLWSSPSWYACWIRAFPYLFFCIYKPLDSLITIQCKEMFHHHLNAKVLCYTTFLYCTLKIIKVPKFYVVFTVCWYLAWFLAAIIIPYFDIQKNHPNWFT